MNIETWRCGAPPHNGQRQRYPGRFLYNIKVNYPIFLSDNSLVMFSGSSDFGITTDIRPESGARIVCPFQELVGESIYDAVLADPPYADHYQNQWGGELPKPKHILATAVRLVKPGGLIGILHIIVIPAYKVLGVERVALHPILAGPNNAMRVFNVFRKI